ncbi:MAG: 3D domain-containing protein [Heliobacteriaceae bacterium]|nr:3D domain-containing protein [Heliobacteriaceae bacterium]
MSQVKPGMVFVLSFVLSLGFFLHIVNLTPVTLVTGGEATTCYTAAGTVGEFLHRRGIAWERGDLVTPDLKALISPGLRVTFTQAECLDLTEMGKVHRLRLVEEPTLAKIREWGIEVDPADRLEFVSPGPVPRWHLVRVRTGVETREEPVAYGRQELTDRTLPVGNKLLLASGAAGRRLVTEVVTWEDGREVERRFLTANLVEKPRDELVVCGLEPPAPPTGRYLVASRGGSRVTRDQAVRSPENDLAGVSQVRTNLTNRPQDRPAMGRVAKQWKMEATAYTHTGNRTASGLWPRVGLIAVDPRVIPLGSHLYVEGYGLAVAADTGGVIKGQIVDVFFDTAQECFQWGRQHRTVYLLE